ncbi:hypothetical protein [Brevibacillus agri]|uniref:hypothetical protein n=1 Tax=Brevibacillus agri TaxID=51101 RepID=UPI0004724CEF|nr:hypothetical protein [Brevibacillus agri]
MQNVDFTELHQYLNDLSASVRQAGDVTGHSLSEVTRQLASLQEQIQTTNYLLTGLLMLHVVFLVVLIWKKSK